MKKIASALFCAILSVSASADNMEDARQLVRNGDYGAARKLLEGELASSPKSASSPQFNYLMGICDFEDGDYAGAKRRLDSARAKGYGAANLYLGKLAFLDYDFDSASEFYDAYVKAREKAGQDPGDDVELAQRQLLTAENSLERVERIVVIDSLAVPSDGFFKAYKLPHSAGRLVSPEEMPLEGHRDGTMMAFLNEGGDFMIWGEPDSLGNVRLLESIRLTDGEWQEPSPTPDILALGGYADYPFMMPDGVTLYYSSDGDESMGGYDIFVASRDPQTGEFLQPQNVGMPFNSPYDDFLLAIDEENGVGWWATDRNRLGDKLTIYVYKVNDLRKNYSPDDEDVIGKARLSDYKSTQDPENISEYEELLAAVDAISPEEVKKKADFYFPKSGGSYYTSFDDFTSPAARDAMRKYLVAKERLASEEKRLSSLRRRYHESPSAEDGRQIARVEKDNESLRKEVVRLRSDVYRAEKGDR